MLLTNVVGYCAVLNWTSFGPSFHTMNAPRTNPEPKALIVKPFVGTFATVVLAGARNVSDEELLCCVRFVLKLEHPDASPKITSPTISHLREYIRLNPSLSNP